MAIHLDRTVNSEGFKFNTETHLTPIMCTNTNQTGNAAAATPAFNHHTELLEQICAGIDRRPEQVVSVDLCLYDAQPAQIGGSRGEFVFSGRLDNLYMSFCALESMIESSADMSGHGIRLGILFDHEEIGSESAQGANSSFIEGLLRRITGALSVKEAESDASEAVERMLSKSLLVSADMAHAVHPNYPEKHEECHRPRMQQGLVLKYNANQRYATNARTAALFKALAARNQLPIQEFVVRNDSPCGSTIGPILSAKLGIPAVDVGVAQLSMHSCREMAGVEDAEWAIRLFAAFFSQFESLEMKTVNP